MSSIFPIRSESTLTPPEGARLIALDDELAGDVLGALASQTARDILAHVYDAPSTPSDLAEATGTSLQNIRYHLDRLLEADLVETVDTWYSETGNEMRVYAPTAAALVLFAGVDDTPTDLEELLPQILGASALLAVGSGLVQLTARLLRSRPDDVSGGGTGTVPTSVVDTIPPGLVFFAGGMLLLVGFVAWWSVRTRVRPP